MAETTATSSQRNIVILGGSYGGVSTAHYVLKHAIPSLPEKESYQVVIVSTSAQAICRPATPRALISDDLFPQDKLFVSISKQFEQYPKGSFRFIKGSASELDHTSRNVTITLPDNTTETLSFYAVVIATGASTPSPLLSFNGDEEQLRKDWNEFRQALPTAKTIVVAGGGPAGIETAGELGEYLNGRAGMFSSKLENPKVKITVISGGSQIIPVLRSSLAKTAEDYLAKVGVTVIHKTKVESVTPEGTGSEPGKLAAKATLTLSDGQHLETDLYIPAFGQTPNTKVVEKSLLSSDGRIETNPSTLRVDKAGPLIYAIGDASSYARPAIHLLMEAVPVLGSNIKYDLLQKASKDGTTSTSTSTATATATTEAKEREFKEDKRETQLVPIGKSKGVGAFGGHSVPSFAVWLIKGRDYWLWTTGKLWSGKQWAKAA